MQTELQNIIQEKDELKKRTEELSYKLLDLERQLDNGKNKLAILLVFLSQLLCYTEQKDSLRRLQNIVIKSIENSEEILKNAIHEVDNPALTALTCSPDYLRSLTTGCLESLEGSLNLGAEHEVTITTASNIAHRLAIFILQGKATCNTSPDITFGDSKIPFIVIIN